ncbi:pseudouridine synthase [Tellurirhabdus bombi]|uniref:pseudouridine synthase n=1 Tax=Tellurirhabdus bombi TaxID=2907205 RepID=UPI001F2E530D|nr:pseudouridine synthase [Tellurirhabdus bombi]
MKRDSREENFDGRGANDRRDGRTNDTRSNSDKAPFYKNVARQNDGNRADEAGDSRPSFERRSSNREDDRPKGNRSSRSEQPFRKENTERRDFKRRDDSRPSFGNRDERPRGDRPAFGDRNERPRGERPSFGDRNERPRGERPSFGNRDERPRGERPPFGDRNERRSPSSDRPERPFRRDNDSRPSGERRSSERGERPFRRDDNDRPTFNRRDTGNSRPFDERRSSDRNERPRGERPFRREENNRNGNERSFGERRGPSSDRNERPKDERPFRRDDNNRYGNERKFDERRGPSSDRPSRPERRPFGDRRNTKQDEPAWKEPERKIFRWDDNKDDRRDNRERRPSSDASDRERRFASEDRRADSNRKVPNYDLDRLKAKVPTNRKTTRNSESEEENDGTIRLNRYIANSGICSRRDADGLIANGEIKVNGNVVTEMGYKVKPSDTVKYGTKALNPEKMMYVLLNKPKDYITTTEDPKERNTVMDLVSSATPYRIYPVGRLDRNTTGLLLITNDGELAEKLTHPSNNIKKVYQVEIDKPITSEHFEQIKEGVELEDGLIKPDDLGLVTPDAQVIGIEIHSGRNRIVRRIFEHFGYEVTKLDRTVYAGLNKKDLPRGNWRYLTEKEVVRLKYLL